MRFQSVGKMRENFCPHFLLLLPNIHIPIFHNAHRKSWPSPLVVARTLAYLVGVPAKSATIRREKTQVRINIQDTREYLECSHQVHPKSSPLHERLKDEGRMNSVLHYMEEDDSLECFYA